MKRQGLVAVAMVALSAAACFTDPTKSLRSGPSLLTVGRAYVSLRPGDSVTTTASLLDNQGNVLPAPDAAWQSASAAIAVARKDTSVVIPGDYFSRGVIRGVATGNTTVTVTARNISATIKVSVAP